MLACRSAKFTHLLKDVMLDYYSALPQIKKINLMFFSRTVIMMYAYGKSQTKSNWRTTLALHINIVYNFPNSKWNNFSVIMKRWQCMYVYMYFSVLLLLLLCITTTYVKHFANSQFAVNVFFALKRSQNVKILTIFSSNFLSTMQSSNFFVLEKKNREIG